MKQDDAFEKDLASIHRLMDRSVKFVSLSGLSGILAGTYALIGAGVAYFMLYYPPSIGVAERYPIPDIQTAWKLVVVAFLVLVASFGTGLWLSAAKAKRRGVSVWGAPGRHLLINLMIPLIAGGCFGLICVWQGYFDLVTSATLIFYGLALVNASPNLYDEVRYLGLSEIALGLASMLTPGYSLLFWAGGFGVLHILYGSILYKKYE